MSYHSQGGLSAVFLCWDQQLCLCCVAPQTVVTLENGKLVQKQSWDGKETNIEREVSDGKLIAVRIVFFSSSLLGKNTSSIWLYHFSVSLCKSASSLAPSIILPAVTVASFPVRCDA